MCIHNVAQAHTRWTPFWCEPVPCPYNACESSIEDITVSDIDFDDLFDDFADPGSVACEGGSHSLLSATDSDCHNSIPDLYPITGSDSNNSVSDGDGDGMPDLWWPDSDSDSSIPDIGSVADCDSEDDVPHLQSVADVDGKVLSLDEDEYLHNRLHTPPLSAFVFANIVAGGGGMPLVMEPIPTRHRYL